jgi:hypothetical protein
MGQQFMNYIIKNEIKDNIYIINIKCNIPNLKINDILNFRIYKSTNNDDYDEYDPNIKNSHFIFEINNKMIKTMHEFKFLFDLREIIEYKSIVVGFCNEFVNWYDETFFKIQIDKNIINKFLNKKELCMLSSWKIKCGISQYSENIVYALNSKNINVNVFQHTEDYNKIISYTKEKLCKAFIVQYEPSLINSFDIFFNFIKRIKNNGLNIFLIIHSEDNNLLKLDGYIDGFIYHKANTIKFKKTKIFKIPMGVPVFEPKLSISEYRKKYNIEEKKLIISTVGFMFAWKNHANILEKLVPYIKQNNDIIIQYMTSFHSINNDECIEEFNKICSIVKNNNIENNFIHITDYISQDELNERLYLSDIGFLWSGIQTTSSSASLKEFVASRLPLVKTNSTHYHDINHGTLTTDQDIDNFVDSIINLINNKSKIFKLKSKMEENYNNLNYNLIINKLIEIINA